MISMMTKTMMMTSMMMMSMMMTSMMMMMARMATWLSRQQHDLAIVASAHQQCSPDVEPDHDYHHHHHHHHHEHHYDHGVYDDDDDQKCSSTGWSSTLCLPKKPLKFGTLK